MSRKRKREDFRIDFSWATRGVPPVTAEELKARKALIPPDRRDLTARLLGDPLPGDRRREMFPGEDSR